jgi:hypothetical protein
MPLIVPDQQEVEVLTAILTPALTIRLYSNNKTPVGTDSVAGYTEVIGGGYVALPLTFANWVITSGNPSQASYNVIASWVFTGVTNAPGSVYGYYVTRNSDGKLMWAERFPASTLPFAPENGSRIQVLPRYAAQSLF